MSEYIEMLGSGGSTTNNLNKTQFSKIKILVPEAKILSQFHEIVEPLFMKIKENQIEIENLTKLRDTLLPKLMSGEIDVSDINFDLKFFFFAILKLNERNNLFLLFIIQTYNK